MRLLSIQIFLFFTCFGMCLGSGSYPIKNFTSEDYKAGIQNIDFVQNRNMNIFVANNLGVLSFNGGEWESHNLSTGKKQRSLAFDEAANRLYVGAQGEFGYFKDKWNYTSLSKDLVDVTSSFDDVWDVYLSGEMVYFCTFKGIFRYDGSQVIRIDGSENIDRSFLVGNRVFTQNKLGDLFEVEGKSLKLVRKAGSRKELIAGIIAEEAGYLIIYKSGLIEESDLSFDSRLNSSTLNYFSGNYINHVLRLSDNRIAISTQTEGIFLFDHANGTYEKIGIDNGLESNACLRSFQDYNGNLWVGMQNGIALININSPMRLINSDIDLEGSGYDVFQTKDGTYYTTSNGLYFLSREGTSCKLIRGTEGPAYEMTEIDGRLYLGHDTGLFLLENGGARKIATTEGLWKLLVLRSSPGYVLAGTYSGLYLFKKSRDRILEPLGAVAGFRESSRFFEEDAQGNIWVSQYYKGIYKLRPSLEDRSVISEVITGNSEIDLSDQVIIGKIRNEIYASSTSGLYKLSNTEDNFEAAGIFSEEIGEQALFVMKQDLKNNVHIVGSDRVGFFKQISGSNFTYVPSSIHQFQYYLNNDLLSVASHSKDGVYYSANQGFILYYPDLESRVNYDSPIIINRIFSVTEDSVLFEQMPFEDYTTPTDEIVVSNKDKVLKVSISPFNYGFYGDQEYVYNLDGFDEGQVEGVRATTKEYSNLNEGQYSLTIRTNEASNLQRVSEELKLKVKPPIHKSMIAKAFYCLAGLSLLYFLNRYQKRRFAKKSMILEEGRQREIDINKKKIEKVEKEKERALTEMRQEKMESELKSVNNLLAASTMNLVVKNDFIATVRKDINEIKNKGDIVETRKALEKVVKGIDRTLRIQEDWEQFEFHFDQVHGDFLARLRDEFPDLTPSEQKLCVFLRLNLNTKEIANLLTISIRGVEVSRYRLRKKLRLEKGTNLSRFILAY